MEEDNCRLQEQCQVHQEVLSRRQEQQVLGIQELDSDQQQVWDSQGSGDSDQQELGSQVLEQLLDSQAHLVLDSQVWQEISGGQVQVQDSLVSCRAQEQFLVGAWSRAAWAGEQRRWQRGSHWRRLRGGRSWVWWG